MRGLWLRRNAVFCIPSFLFIDNTKETKVFPSSLLHATIYYTESS